MYDRDVTPNLRDDSMFLIHLREGNGMAFDTLVNVYRDSLVQYATRLVNSVDMAQDIVQEVFLNLWRERSHIDSSWDISAYLYGLTRKRAIDFARSTYTTTQRDERWASQLHTDIGADTMIDISDDEASEAKAKVDEALKDVSARCREVFMLVWEEELSYAEIARRKGIAVSSVRVYVGRALKRLIEVLRPEQVFKE